MKFLSIKEALKKGKGKVAMRGWVYRERSGKDKVFLVLRDHSDIIQCVVDEKSKFFKDAKSLLIESSVKIEGQISKDSRAPTGYEVKVSKLEVVHKSEKFPITKDQSTEFLLDKRHLWLRSRKMIAIMKIRSTVFKAIHDFFRDRGFYEFHSPIFQSTQAEGGSTLFEVKYFGDKTYLGQTWQLYAEAAIFALEKIYTISPSFRAEKSKTSRHLTEYWHAEMEAAWASFEELQDYSEDLLRFIVGEILRKHKEELKILKRDVSKLEIIKKKKFVRITYDEAIKKLQKKGIKIEWGKDLRTIEEDELSRMYDVPIIVTHYPKVVKAFYMKEETKEVVRGFDVIGTEGYGELIGASERETDIVKLKEKLKEMGEKVQDYEYYLDTRRFGSVPHGGFGMGVERVISWICGLDSIKDAIAFPRTMLRSKP